MHVVLVNRLGSLSLPRKSVVRLTDRPDMPLDVYRGRKTTKQHIDIIDNSPHFLVVFSYVHLKQMSRLKVETNIPVLNIK